MTDENRILAKLGNHEHPITFTPQKHVAARLLQEIAEQKKKMRGQVMRRLVGKKIAELQAKADAMLADTTELVMRPLSLHDDLVAKMHFSANYEALCKEIPLEYQGAAREIWERQATQAAQLVYLAKVVQLSLFTPTGQRYLTDDAARNLDPVYVVELWHEYVEQFMVSELELKKFSPPVAAAR